MGLEEIFTSNASFPGLAEYGKTLPDVFVSHAKHEAFANVTEFQTVTTAATSKCFYVLYRFLEIKQCF